MVENGYLDHGYQHHQTMVDPTFTAAVVRDIGIIDNSTDRNIHCSRKKHQCEHGEIETVAPGAVPNPRSVTE